MIDIRALVGSERPPKDWSTTEVAAVLDRTLTERDACSVVLAALGDSGYDDLPLGLAPALATPLGGRLIRDAAHDGVTVRRWLARLGADYVVLHEQQEPGLASWLAWVRAVDRKAARTLGVDDPAFFGPAPSAADKELCGRRDAIMQRAARLRPDFGALPGRLRCRVPVEPPWTVDHTRLTAWCDAAEQALDEAERERALVLAASVPLRERIDRRLERVALLERLGHPMPDARLVRQELATRVALYTLGALRMMLERLDAEIGAAMFGHSRRYGQRLDAACPGERQVVYVAAPDPAETLVKAATEGGVLWGPKSNGAWGAECRAFVVHARPASAFSPGWQWGWRLFRGTAHRAVYEVDPPIASPSSRPVPSRLRTAAIGDVEEVPAWLVFGPDGERLAARLERLHHLTEEELLGLGQAGSDESRAAAGGFGAALGHAKRWAQDHDLAIPWSYAYAQARNILLRRWHRADVAVGAAASAVQATIVEHALPDRFKVLADPWLSVIERRTPQVTEARGEGGIE